MDWHQNYPQIVRESGFKLHQNATGDLDWRLLNSFDVEKIIREQNFERIDEIVEHIAEAPIANLLNSHILDSGIAKYFSLAQLSVQFLQYCKKYLNETVNNLSIKLKETKYENIRLKDTEKESNQEILQLHRRIEKFEMKNRIVYPCTFCSKNFVSNEMLNTHVQRKHSPELNKEINNRTPENNDRKLIDTIKLELEIKQLKERLNHTERELRDRNFTQPQDKSSKIIQCLSCKQCEQITAKKNETKSIQSSSIQMSTIGIQTNFDENKELDDKEEIDKCWQINLLEEVRTKITQLEIVREQEQQENKSSAKEIKDKLIELSKTFEEKQNQLAQKIPKSIEIDIPINFDEKIKEILQICNQNMISLYRESEEKLNSNLLKIEKVYERKFQSIENLIERKNFIKSEENLMEIKKKTDPFSATVAKISQNENLKRLSRPSDFLMRAKSFQISSHDESDCESISSDSLSSERSESHSSETSSHSIKFQDVTTSTPKKSAISRQNIEAKKNTSVAASHRKRKQDALQLLKKRLTSVGVSSKTKTISNTEMTSISQNIAEQRNKIRKKFKTFFVTRNKLKILVDNLTKERINKADKRMPKDSSKKKEAKIIHKETESRISKVTLNDKIAVDTNQSSSRLMPATTSSSPSNLNQNENEMEDFKTRLERILESPIQKPIIVSVDETLQQQTLQDKEIEEIALQKPIPIPRKRVMFDINSPESSAEKIKSQAPATADTDSEISSFSNF